MFQKIQESHKENGNNKFGVWKSSLYHGDIGEITRTVRLVAEALH